MSQIFVPRTFGGTLILTVAPPPASVVPTVVIIATFRDGQVNATCRDGSGQATFRDGIVTAGGR